MAQITRFNGNIKPFADDSLGTERTVFGAETQDDTLDANLNTDFFRGWGIVGVNGLPTKQDFNAFAYTSTALTAYLHQMGVAEWNASQEYFTDSITNEGGVLYKALQDNVGVLPSTDVGANWESITGNSYTLPQSDETTLGGVEKATTTEAIDETSDKNITADNAKSLKCSAKAWVNFNGSGTVSIRDSYNVSSIIDNGTGNFTVNFTNPMANADYAVAFSNSNGENVIDNYTTTGFRVRCFDSNGGAINSIYISAVVFGELA